MAVRNKMEDLRNHLFDALERVMDGDMEVDKARAVVDIGKVLVETQRAQTEYIRVLNTDGWVDRRKVEEAGSWIGVGSTKSLTE